MALGRRLEKRTVKTKEEEPWWFQSAGQMDSLVLTILKARGWEEKKGGDNNTDLFWVTEDSKLL